MILDYNNLEFDSHGRPETPELQLRTLSGEILGVIPNAHNIKLDIKFSEPSELTFTVPALTDGEPTPFYDQLTGYRLIYTKCYGVYVILEPQQIADGIQDTTEVTAYSLEKTLEMKKFFLEEGTFNFWNPGASENTILGRMLEVAPGWGVGIVSPTLIGRYRTFEDYDDYLLSFAYDTCPEKYRCVFVFDTYKKTINVYDADEERPMLPIYLDFENLLNSVEINELTDEMVTALRPYGADDLDIREVNPIGTNWIYDISYFIANGDIPDALAKKWLAWQKEVIQTQNYYRGLTALKFTATSKLITLKTELTDLNGELTDLTNQQSVDIQALAMEVSEQGKQTTQQRLDETNRKIEKKKAEIAAKEAEIAKMEEQINGKGANSYSSKIKAVTDRLGIKNYFTKAEYETLSQYFIEQDMTEETFVASEVDVDFTGATFDVNSGKLNITGTKLIKAEAPGGVTSQIFTMAGGTFIIRDANNGEKLSGDIIRGSCDYQTNGDIVVSIYGGSLKSGDTTAETGCVTITGKGSGLTTDVKAVNDQDVITYEGTTMTVNLGTCSMYLTAAIGDYQRYGVAMDLFEFAVETLSDLAIPTYEFSVESGNFIFAHEFEPFRKKLELGKGVYLRMPNGQVLHPLIIEFELDFESEDTFSLVFSNRFKRMDDVFTLKDMIENSYSTSRSFDASKYLYKETSSQMSSVSKFLSDSLDAAKNSILSSKNQSVLIDGAGIHVSGDDNYQLRIIDSMIAMTDDGWQHAKLAIGRFASPEVGEYWGVNAEVIGGKLFVGNNLIIENSTDDGTMQFRVDASGAWLYNATFVLVNEDASYFSKVRSEDEPSIVSSDDIETTALNVGGKIILDPLYGIAAGNKNLFTLEGTHVTPSFLNKSSGLVLDDEDMPKNANFYLDAVTGKAYFRGRLQAKEGLIGGWTISDGMLFAGDGTTYVALNGDNSDYSQWTMWAGSETPSDAPFWVKKDGTFNAKNADIKGNIEADSGTFHGTVYASDGSFTGTIVAKDGSIGGWTIAEDKLWCGSGDTYVALDGGSGDYAIWAGSQTASAAEFSVKRDGTLHASNGFFQGQINATSGTFTGTLHAKEGDFTGELNAVYGSIGGWHIETDSKLWTGSGSSYVGLNGKYTGYSTDLAIWAGAQSGSSAPLRIYKNGKIYASDAELTGAITAKSGNIGGWTITDKSRLYSGSGTSYVALNGGSVSDTTYAMWAGSGSASSAPFSVKRSGEIKSTSGVIGGWTIGSNSLHSGNGTTYVELNSNSNSSYAIWVGSNTSSSAPFSVKRDGSLYAKSATLRGSTFQDKNGNGMMDSDYKFTHDYLNLKGLNINDNFIVDSNGKVTIRNGSIDWGAVTGKDGLLSDIGAAQTAAETAQSAAEAADRKADNAQGTANDALSKANSAYSEATSAQQEANDAMNDAQSALEKFNSWTAADGTHIDGKNIATDTILVTSLYGGTINIYNGTGSGRTVTGYISTTNTTGGWGIQLASKTGLRLVSNGNLWAEASGGSFGIISGDFKCEADCCPNSTTGSYKLGNMNYKWSDLYCSNSTIQTSDRNAKNTIEDLPDKYLDMFDKLTPKRYKLNDGTSGRFHVGLIAQDVEEAMLASGIESKEFGGFIKGVDDDGIDVYMLRYGEFIAIMIEKIKRLEARISELEKSP